MKFIEWFMGFFFTITSKSTMTREVISYELYFHDHHFRSKESSDPILVDGEDLEEDLLEKELIHLAVLLSSEVVQSWIANPSTYPEEFKEVHPCLWGDVEIINDRFHVCHLTWHRERIYVDWARVDGHFNCSKYPALIQKMAV